ncbi:MAG TPA: redoxin family protein [Devosiaceae bacterium]|jgi:peroxiredoxin|nr:redoxin family protein [Devosiaceae bacterium]
MIQPGDEIPAVPVKLVSDAETVDTTADAVLGSGRIVFFTVPGAFTPTCDTSHLPGFLANAGKLRDHGITRIVCGTVNDHHVTRAWAERSEALGKVDFIADVHCTLAEALGLTAETANLGRRFRRCAMIIVEGVVQDVFVQDVAGVTVSGAPAVLLALEASTSSVSA